MYEIFGKFMTLGVYSLFSITTVMYVLYYYPHFFRGYKKFDKQISSKEFTNLIKLNELPEFIIQITTKGGEMDIISRGLKNLDSVLSQLPKKIRSKIKVDILTEQINDKDIIETLKLNFLPNVTAVPIDYQTSNQTRLKARALQYMAELRSGIFQKNGRDLKNVYIIYFDAESTIDLEGIRTIIGTVVKNKHIRIFQGPIFYSNDWLKSGVVSRQMESLRPWNCYECYSLTSRGIPYHLHGSNIVVRGDTEIAIGWDFGNVKGYPVVAEDLFFGIMGYMKFGSAIFGWHGARMIEQPAFKLQDSVNQRIRWIRGSLQALEVVKNWNEYHKSENNLEINLIFRIRLKLYFYALGFIPSFISIGGLIYLFFINIVGFYNLDQGYRGLSIGIFSTQNPAVYVVSIIPRWMIFVSFIGGLLWLLTIQIGLYHNLKSIEMKQLSKIKEHLLILMISPIATLIDTGIAFFTLITWFLGYKKAVWEITPKTT